MSREFGPIPTLTDVDEVTFPGRVIMSRENWDMIVDQTRGMYEALKELVVSIEHGADRFDITLPRARQAIAKAEGRNESDYPPWEEKVRA